MNRPNCIIKLSDQTQEGALNQSAIQKIRNCLRSNGFVLLPSDTCYSVAALAFKKETSAMVSQLLNRPKDPISSAFPDISRAEYFVDLNNLSKHLLMLFTPGPLTVVCKAKPTVPLEFTSGAVGSFNRTIGVRIPDSRIERDVAACTPLPITTVAIRDSKNGNPITNFEQATEFISEQLKNAENKNMVWGAAIEGRSFYAKHSTVIRVTDDTTSFELLREGDISVDRIESACGDLLPST